MRRQRKGPRLRGWSERAKSKRLAGKAKIAPFTTHVNLSAMTSEARFMWAWHTYLARIRRDQGEANYA